MTPKTRGRKPAVTLKDIAGATGFSANTVSRALADKPDISLETKKLVQEKADEMGYIANASASFLRSGVSKIISIIVGDISNPHFSFMVKEMQTLLQRRGYTSIIFNTEEKADIERQAIITSISQNVDGVLICPAPGAQENIRFLQKHHLPFVLVGRRFGEMGASYAICDDEESGYLATKHLIAAGHRGIMYFNGTKGISSAFERLKGYQRALEEAGILYQREWVHSIGTDVNERRKKFRRTIEQNQDCTAVLAFNDMVAWEVICLLDEMGHKVPQEYSVAGFDNIRFMYPLRLTSVAPRKGTMGRKAVDSLLRQLNHQSTGAEYAILPTMLVEGDTVGVPRSATCR